MTDKLFVFALVLAASSLAQVQIAPFAQTAPVLEPSLNCPVNQDKIWFADVNGGTVNEVCIDSSKSPVFLRLNQHTLAHIPGVQRIIPIGRKSFYAFSWTKIFQYTSENGFPTLYSWRNLAGNGTPDPLSVQQNSVVVRYPDDHEVVRLHLFPGAYAASPEPLFDTPPGFPVLSYAKVLRNSHTFQAWLSPGQYVWLPAVDGAGILDPYNGKRLFEGQNPVDMVVMGDSFYVTLPTSYGYPPTPPTPIPTQPIAPIAIPGKLVQITPTGGVPIINVLDAAAFLDSNYAESELAVSSRGVYYITEHTFLGTNLIREIEIYDFLLKSVRVVMVDIPVLNNGQEAYYSSVAVAPAQ